MSDKTTPADFFENGIRSITPVRRPRFPGWQEFDVPRQIIAMGGVARGYYHAERRLNVISAVEVADDGKVDKGRSSTCRSAAARRRGRLVARRKRRDGC